MTETETKIFLQFLKQNRVHKPELEYPFARSKGRKFRFDFAWPDQSVALECDGGVWSGGRHTRGSGWMKDSEKLNLAATMGWRMLRCTPSQLCTDEMMDTIKQALEYEEAA